MPAEPGVFSPIYVDDLVDAIVRAGTVPAAAGQVLTITDGSPVSNAEFFGHYARMLGVDLPVEPAAVLRVRYDALARAEREAGRQPALDGQAVDYLLRTGSYSTAKARRLLDWSRPSTSPRGCAGSRPGRGSSGSCRRARGRR